MSDTVVSLLRQLSDVGTDHRRGGYSRPVYSAAELTLREWFVEQAERRHLDVETDRNGLLWAWSAPGGTRDGAIVTGSHLDSVPGGGAYDGPLGVASALVAFDELRRRHVSDRPLAIVVFPEEEGSRFGVACLGSRLLTGAIDPDRARNLADDEGNTFAEIAQRNGLDPQHIGPDPQSLARIRTFVELHVEQGRGLIDLGRPVGIGSSILGHGRWRLSIAGEGNHAGTTRMAERRDPMVTAGRIVVEVRELAQQRPDARATVGKLIPVPGGTNVIASRVDLWLDVRHPSDAITAELVSCIEQRAKEISADEACTVTLVEESFSPTVDFDPTLTCRLAEAIPGAPLLATGAGHDAGVLKEHVDTAMLFVRNPTGISHSSAEAVDDADAEQGALALADSLELLTAL